MFEERENRSTRRKTSRRKDENQQQTQPIYHAESRNRTRATLVGGECYHHCAIPDPASKSIPFSNKNGSKTLPLGAVKLLLYLSVSTRVVIGQFSGPYFTVRPAKIEICSFPARPIEPQRWTRHNRYTPYLTNLELVFSVRFLGSSCFPASSR